MNNIEFINSSNNLFFHLNKVWIILIPIINDQGK